MKNLQKGTNKNGTKSLSFSRKGAILLILLGVLTTLNVQPAHAAVKAQSYSNTQTQQGETRLNTFVSNFDKVQQDTSNADSYQRALDNTINALKSTDKKDMGRYADYLDVKVVQDNQYTVVFANDKIVSCERLGADNVIKDVTREIHSGEGWLQRTIDYRASNMKNEYELKSAKDREVDLLIKDLLDKITITSEDIKALFGDKKQTGTTFELVTNSMVKGTKQAKPLEDLLVKVRFLYRIERGFNIVPSFTKDGIFISATSFMYPDTYFPLLSVSYFHSDMEGMKKHLGVLPQGVDPEWFKIHPIPEKYVALSHTTSSQKILIEMDDIQERQREKEKKWDGYRPNSR